MFNRNMYENSRPDGIAVMEIVNGVKPAGSRVRLFVPLKTTELKGELDGPLASLRSIQTYGYSRDRCDMVLEAVYRFPLPGDAAVTGVRVSFGDVVINAELKERGQAQADYDAAVAEGRQAALVTREAHDVFTLQVAGLQPDQDVTVETTYIQLGRSEGAGWSLRFPLTTAPRYVRDDERNTIGAQAQPLLSLRDPGHRFSLDLTLSGAGEVTSPTHALEVTRDGDVSRVRLRDGEVLPDRDCVLSWQPQCEPDRSSLQVFIHDDLDSFQSYFLALVAPPSEQVPAPGVPREVVLLVDHSGSMEGPKWEAADWAVKQFLYGLSEGDLFALGLFHDRTAWFSKRPVEASATSVANAIRFLEEHTDSGGTELGVALEQALGLYRQQGDFARNILIATDAEVSDLGRIMRLATRESAREDRRRISVLCIDAAPNSLLATELAERGGGVSRFLTSAPSEGDISTALEQVLLDWAQPVLKGLKLSLNRADVQAAGREVTGGDGPQESFIDLGDLPRGRPLWVAGRLPRDEAFQVEFRLVAAGSLDLASVRLDAGQNTADRPALKALFGARRVFGLEFLMGSGYRTNELQGHLERLGYDLSQLEADWSGKEPPVYAENQADTTRQMLRGLLVAEALQYGLACSETAFVAVRSEAGQPVEGSVAVASALPSGWSDEFLSVATSLAGPAGMPTDAADFDMLLDAPGPAEDISGPTSASAGILSRLWPFRGQRTTGAAGVPDALAISQTYSTAREAATTVLFTGVPSFTDGEAILFDSSRDQDSGRIPGRAKINRLEVRFPGGTPADDALDPGLELLVFVDDLSLPRARVRLADVVRQGGVRPLNFLYSLTQVLRIVLVDPAGAWAEGGPEIEVAMGW